MFGSPPFGNKAFGSPADGQFAAPPDAPSSAGSGTSTIGGMFGCGTFGEIPFADTVTAAVVAPPAAVGGGGGGPVREVRAFAKLLGKPTKAQKKAIKREIAEEALELLPDVPQARELAPIIAQLVYAQTAPAFANWTPVRAMQPLPASAQAVLQAKVAAFLQQIALQEEIDDEHVIELLLLG